MDFLLEQNASKVPETLTSFEIGYICFPDDEDTAIALTRALEQGCIEGKIKYLSVRAKVRNVPRHDSSSIFNIPELARFDDYLIHRDDFKKYLQSVDKWPIDGALANWWQDEQLQTQVLDDDASGQIPVKMSSTDIIYSYMERKIDFDKWLMKSHPDISNTLVMKVTVSEAFNEVKAAAPTLWSIGISTFKRDFWQRYSEETGIKGRSGRPKTK